MSIVIDTNAAETILFDAMVEKFGKEVVRRERLELADVVLEGAERVLAVERKELADLEAMLPVEMILFYRQLAEAHDHAEAEREQRP